jgi:anti-sigma factor RsiW
MNPDKLFDYLDGKLTAAERAALERQLIFDPQLQRELAVAREIHAGMRSDSREIFLAAGTDVTQRGRKIALRVGAVFIILMAVNVGVGLWLIARHETKNPNRALLEAQMRQQISKALEHAATTLTPAPLGVSELTIPAATGKLDSIAEQVVTITSGLGGSALKGLPENHRLSVLVNLPANRESEFRTAIASIAGAKAASSASAATQTAPPITPEPGATIAAKVEKKSFVVQIVEPASKQD